MATSSAVKKFLQSLAMWILVSTAICLVIGVAMTFFGLGTRVIGILLGVELLFFVPGICLTFLVLPFPNSEYALRAALIAPCGIAIQPTLFFLLLRLGAPAVLLTAIATSLAISIVAVFIAVQKVAKKNAS